MRAHLKPGFVARVLTSLVLLQVVVNAREPCQVSENYTDPGGIPYKHGVRQTTTGCRGSSSGNFEVHVIGDYDETMSVNKPKTSQVNIRGISNTSIILVLMNTGHVIWNIESDQGVAPSLVLLMSTSTHTTVDLSKARNTTNVPVQKTKPPAGTESLENAARIVDYLQNMFLAVKSFSGTNTADKWVLQLGRYKEPAPTTTVSPQTAEEECLQDVNCWLQYDFSYDDNWTDCHGERYVTQTSFSVGKYVGVVLCSASRYKLFMANSLEEKYLNMADGSGAGEDWCVVIGGDESSARLSSNTFNCPTAVGFYRSFKGDNPKHGKIGAKPDWTGKYYPTWYECGVQIPGKSRVVTKSVPPSTTVTTTTTTTAATTTSPQNASDDVQFGQVKFTKDRTFIVPDGVTRVDVICIGGGGGGRDGHAAGMATGDGGNSTFGSYLVAGGGKGAQTDNSGGAGGYGTIANGGQGGKGGGCSAGAGAAGQTNGGGYNGLEAGSSDNPFCGGGGSSGGSSCGNIFGSIEPGHSGLGGKDPKGRAGGLYGGGGGSRAGGRAGGGGGYSRAVITVVPKERIVISVGKAGEPAYWGGKPAQGIVVVSWGGPIKITGSFIDQLSVSDSAPTTTAAPPTPTVTTLPRKKCSYWHCSGGYKMRAVCVNGFCECKGSGYNKYTCLPEVGSCLILSNQDNALATPGGSGSSAIHSCVGSSAKSAYEVHVIGMYEPLSRSSPGVTLRITGITKKPVVLVLANYEAVSWEIQAEPELDVREIKLFSYKSSDVNLVGPANSSSVTITKSRSPRGRGDDSGGGDTAGLLKLLTDEYGDVASFTGTYRTSSWGLVFPGVSGANITAAPIKTTGSVEACLSSGTCWVKYDFTYDDSWTACSGERYVRRTPYSTGKYIGVILCSATRYKLVMADGLNEMFLNIGDVSGAGEDLCELVGSDQKSAKLSSDFWDSPSVQGYYRANAGETPQKGKIGFGPKNSSQWTGKYFPTWYECGIPIPGGLSVVLSNSTNAATTTTASATTTTATTSTTTSALAGTSWDKVNFAQMKYTGNTRFTVPPGVTKVDVICIGGGGGGRGGHVPFSRNPTHGGNGGNSTFGDYLWAEGGKGANEDDTGGEGGWGLTADGGQGGIGGSCSAGAGAAGQTSGGGAGGLEAGSSTYPFCGAGGSSGGTSCGTEFRSIAPGSSGPGGKDPVGRHGGLYGGGGGSRAGARAGGGGGYSRAVINVTPGEEIEIIVGEIGKPYYPAGKPAPGVVVVSWGGPINPYKPLP